MKPVLALVFIVFCRFHQSESIDFFDTILNKIKEFGASVLNALKTFGNKIKRFIFPEPEIRRLPANDNKDDVKNQPMFNNNAKQVPPDMFDTKYRSLRKLRSEEAILMSVPQLITLHGKMVESHVVLTQDGHFLTLHHLRNKNYKSTFKSFNATVLLHHGLLGSSADWILLGPEKSLPYLLLNVGCDVWLTNARGNHYSRGFVSIKTESEFWKFSWQEMSQYDLPAVIDYIRLVKKTEEKITYIGHSMGATVFLGMISLFPEYNKYFRVGIFLAPLVFMTNAEGPLRALSSVAANPPEDLLQVLGKNEFMPDRKVPRWIANKYCKGPEIYCTNPSLFLTGSVCDENTYDQNLIAGILNHVPCGGSTNTVLHFAQMIKSGKFQHFRNKLEEFSLQNVSVPVILFSSNDDLIAPVTDVLKLYFNLSCPIDHFIIRDKNINHMDFVWNPEAFNLVFSKIINNVIGNISCDTKINDIL